MMLAPMKIQENGVLVESWETMKATLPPSSHMLNHGEAIKVKRSPLVALEEVCDQPWAWRKGSLLIESKKEMPLPFLDPSQLQPKSHAICFCCTLWLFLPFLSSLYISFIINKFSLVSKWLKGGKFWQPKSQAEISFLYEHIILNTYMILNIRWLQGFKRTYERILCRCWKTCLTPLAYIPATSGLLASINCQVHIHKAGTMDIMLAIHQRLPTFLQVWDQVFEVSHSTWNSWSWLQFWRKWKYRMILHGNRTHWTWIKSSIFIFFI